IVSQSSAIVVLKRGAEGCMVYSADSPSPVSARSFKIEVLNVLGAGDSFMSGFLRGWLRNESLENCALYGNACGALVVTRHGCSPSSPSFAEVEHFIRNFDKVPNLAHHPKMNQLHSRTEFGKPRNRELLILVFDHKTQFEESCRTGNLPQEKILRFKELVHQGFHAVSQNIKDNNLAILIDPKYGKKILNDSSDFNYTVGVPIEDEGIFPLNWLCEGSLYQHLLERPSTWFVKVLFRFHTKMNPEDKKSQLTQLRKLSGVCSELKRKLMVELIIPEDFSQEDASTVNEVALTEAIDEVYKEGIYPYWWKINALDSKENWVKLNEIMDENDPEAGVIFQCNYSQIEKLPAWLGAARSNFQRCGLAVGQSIFSEPWEKYINGNAYDAEVISEIAERFQKLLKVWSDF
nr:PfkB family carbohydrate kinase [SAR324 cluster bacterium]